VLSKETFEYIKPVKNQVMKIIFGKEYNQDILQDFLQAILQEEVHIIRVQTEVTWKKNLLEEKTMRSDILVETEEGINLIEFQSYYDGQYEVRLICYEGDLIQDRLLVQKSYNALQKGRIITIADKPVIKIPGYYEKTVRVAQSNRNIPLLNHIEHYIVDISKFKEEIDLSNPLHQWIAFLKFENKEVLEMVAEKNERIKRALEEMDRLMGEEDVRRSLQAMLNARLERELEINTAREDGEAVGLKKGLKQGVTQGVKLGRQEGRQEGKREAIQFTIKNMIREGIADELIEKVTGVSKKELKKQKELVGI